MYRLKHDKRSLELIISSINSNRELKDDEVGYWNEYIWIATNRKVLREKAQEIKKEWIEETRKELETLENLKIKTEYK